MESQSDDFFGRESIVRQLCDRARTDGITIISGRPLIGKTWTLLEVQRRLEEEGSFILGYHESTAAERSHMLYAVANLYGRWLEDSSKRQQAIMLWEQHRQNLLPQIARMISRLLASVSAAGLPGEVTGVVRQSFDGLATLQSDLESGGLKLPELPYDQAQSLVALVQRITNRRIVLVLDAWEKSPTRQEEYATINHIIFHLADWKNVHIFLSVRSPDLDSGYSSVAIKQATLLSRLRPIVGAVDLPPMELTSPIEERRILRFVRASIRSAIHATDEQLLEMIAGFPGVLNFWLSAQTRKDLLNLGDLRRHAENAHRIQYAELDHFIEKFSDRERLLVARIAFLPNMNSEKWRLLQPIVADFENCNQLIDQLADCGVFEKRDYPTMGHDTRLNAMRRLFAINQPMYSRRIICALIEALASRVTSFDPACFPYIDTLLSVSRSIPNLEFTPESDCLVRAARSVIGGDNAGIKEPDFLRLAAHTAESNDSVAELVGIGLFNRGNANGSLKNFSDAISDFSAVLALKGISPELRAKAHCNRGVTHSEQGLLDEAFADLSVAAATGGVSSRVRAKALVHRALISTQRGDSNTSIADYSEVIEDSKAPASFVGLALLNRGWSYGQNGAVNEEMQDYDSVVTLKGALPDSLAQALINRADVKSRSGDIAGALTDLTAAIVCPDAGAKLVVKALIDRGCLREQVNPGFAIADFTAAISMNGIPVEDLMVALNKRAMLRGMQGDLKGAIADCDRVTSQVAASHEARQAALLNRAQALMIAGEYRSALRDCHAACDLPGISPDDLAKCRIKIAAILEAQGNRETAIEVLTEVCDATDLSAERRASALNERAILLGASGDVCSSLSDLQAVLDLGGVPPDQAALALYNCSVAKGLQGQLREKIEYCNRAAELPGASQEIVAAALIGCGRAHEELGEFDASIEAFNRAADSSEELPEKKAEAIFSRGFVHGKLGDAKSQLADWHFVAEMSGAGPEMRSLAQLYRGMTKGSLGNADLEFDDYGRALETSSEDSVLTARILLHRAKRYVETARPEKAIEDLSSLMNIPNIPRDLADEVERRLRELKI